MKGAKPDAWMPLYIGDYLADTARLSTEQHGAYLLLIMDYWRNGSPADDDEELAEITRLDLKTWKRNRPKLERFFRIEGGRWLHKRIDEELEGAQTRSDRAADRAQTAANARWERERARRAAQAPPDDAPSNARGNASSNAPSNAKSMLEECPSPSPSQSLPVSNETDVDTPSDRLAEIRALPKAKGCWRLALLVLTEHGGLAEPKARSFVGKLKHAGLSDEQLWQIAEDAWTVGTQDPVPYLTRAAEAVLSRTGVSGGITDPSERQQRAWAEDWREKPFSWKVHERGPRPGEPGCRVSPEILAEFGIGAEAA